MNETKWHNRNTWKWRLHRRRRNLADDDYLYWNNFELFGRLSAVPIVLWIKKKNLGSMPSSIFVTKKNFYTEAKEPNRREAAYRKMKIRSAHEFLSHELPNAINNQPEKQKNRLPSKSKNKKKKNWKKEPN